MFNIIKKTCIATLFFGSILLPMDQSKAPISIITVLDKSIQFFSKEIAALGDKIKSADSREHLRKQLEHDKSKLQQLLELNQSAKQQLLDNDAKKSEKLPRLIAPKIIPDSTHSHQIVNTILTNDKETFETLGRIKTTNQELDKLLDEALKNTSEIQTKQKFKNHANERAYYAFLLVPLAILSYFYFHR